MMDDADDSTPVDDASQDVTPVETEASSLALSTGIYAAGINGALQRTGHIDTARCELLGNAALTPAWKPVRIPISTFGFTFPDGLGGQDGLFDMALDATDLANEYSRIEIEFFKLTGSDYENFGMPGRWHSRIIKSFL